MRKKKTVTVATLVARNTNEDMVATMAETAYGRNKLYCRSTQKMLIAAKFDDSYYASCIFLVLTYTSNWFYQLQKIEADSPLSPHDLPL